MSDYTSIPVSKDFRNAIHSQKSPGESYEQILRQHIPAEMLKAGD